MLKTGAKLAAVVAGGVATIAALSGCEASQINWANHTYTVSGGCVQPQVVTLHNGTGTGSQRDQVSLEKVYYGDLNHDGVQDAVVVLSCSAAPLGGNATGTEIQVFTRDGKPVARLRQPDRYGNGDIWGDQFNPGNIGIHDNVLYTGAYGWEAGACHACATRYDIYRWDWNGHGFTPVDVSSRSL